MQRLFRKSWSLRFKFNAYEQLTGDDVYDSWERVDRDHVTIAFTSDHSVTETGFRLGFHREPITSENITDDTLNRSKKSLEYDSYNSSYNYYDYYNESQEVELNSSIILQNISYSYSSNSWNNDYYFNNDTQNDKLDSEFEHLFENFTDDYFQLYKLSNRDDFSDVRQAVFFDRTTVQVNGHQRDDFIVQCSFGGKKCDRHDLTEYDDPMYGKCFTFRLQLVNR